MLGTQQLRSEGRSQCSQFRARHLHCDYRSLNWWWIYLRKCRLKAERSCSCISTCLSLPRMDKLSFSLHRPKCSRFWSHPVCRRPCNELWNTLNWFSGPWPKLQHSSTLSLLIPSVYWTSLPFRGSVWSTVGILAYSSLRTHLVALLGWDSRFRACSIRKSKTQQVSLP